MEIETAATTIRIERALDQRKGQIEDLKAINALIGQQLYQLENIPIKFIKMATIDFTGLSSKTYSYGPFIVHEIIIRQIKNALLRGWSSN